MFRTIISWVQTPEMSLGGRAGHKAEREANAGPGLAVYTEGRRAMELGTSLNESKQVRRKDRVSSGIRRDAPRDLLLPSLIFLWPRPRSRLSATHTEEQAERDPQRGPRCAWLPRWGARLNSPDVIFYSLGFCIIHLAWYPGILSWHFLNEKKNVFV